MSVHAMDVDGVGGLAGPVDGATVGVQTQVMRLLWVEVGWGHHCGRLDNSDQFKLELIYNYIC